MKNLSKVQILFLSCTLFFYSSFLNAQCPPPVHPDYDALMDIFNNNVGDWGWSGNNDWGQNCDPCTWAYLGCDANGRVDSLNLRHKNLQGDLGTGIADLTELVYLDLSNNNLGAWFDYSAEPGDIYWQFTSGLPIPNEINQLQNLTYLNIAQNNYNDRPLPDSLNLLQNLETLIINTMQTDVDFPLYIYSMNSLKHLDISLNQFENITLNGISNLSQLEVLKSAHNNFQGTIPSELGQMSSLREIDLSSNDFSSGLAFLEGNLPNLEKVNVSENALAEPFPALISLPSLKELDLSFNSISGNLSSGIGFSTGLEYLFLESNNFSGAIPDDIGFCSSLIHLNLKDNDFSSSIPNQIGQLVSLEILNMQINDISGNLPVEIGQLISLRELILSANSIAGNIPAEIGQCSSLEYLDMSSNQIGGPIPTEIGLLTELAELHISFNNLVSIPNEISLLDSLTEVNLRANNLSGNFPADIHEMTSLTTLDIRDNAYSVSLPGNLFECPSLKTLLIDNNDFSGSIPAEIGMAQSLRKFEARNNMLSGEIPTEIGLNQTLERLILNENLLSGNIPIELGQCTSMGVLSLTDNLLTGNIPVELVQPPSIFGLNLSDNNLSGCIPPLFYDKCSFVNIALDDNPLLPWEGQSALFCNSGGTIADQQGAPCDDGDPSTIGDVINSDCSCGGAMVDLIYYIPTIAYLDLNSNNEYDDAVDFILENQLFQNSFGMNYYQLSDGTGYMSTDSTAILEVTHIDFPFWSADTPSILHNLNPNTAEYPSHYQMTPDTLFESLSVDITSSIVRCNSEVNYWVTVQNVGTTFSSSSFDVVLDDSLSYVTSDILPDAVMGNTFTFSYDSLPPTHSISYHIIVETPGVGAIGDIISVEATSSDFSAIHEEELVCAYDPNDKLVEPRGVYEQNFTSFEDSILTYTIRFQNTGNDTAFTVIVRDTLSELLELDSYHFISSSHDVVTEIDKDHNLLTFHFENIMLPDSNVDETASHGFVKFQIEIMDGLDEGTPIENTAEIYFDQNPEIVTNTTLNTFATPPFVTNTSVDEIEASDIFAESTLSLFPNPVMDQLTILLPSLLATQSEGMLFLIDMQGRILQTIDVQNSAEMSVDVSTLSKGMYTLMYSDGVEQVMEKFVKM